MNRLKGKKTYIAAAALALLGVGLVMRGADSVGMYCILTAAGFVGLGDRANRHQAEIIAAIGDVTKLVEDARSKAPAITTDDAIKVIGDALALKQAASDSDSASEGH